MRPGGCIVGTVEFSVVTDCLFLLFLSAVVPSWAHAWFPLTSWKNVKVRIAEVLSDYVSEKLCVLFMGTLVDIY